jgi:anthranilate phosphoribosyltransferase
MSNVQVAIQQLFDQQNLSTAEIDAAMSEIMAGEASDAQIGAFLAALRMKGETVDEIAGCASAMTRSAVQVPFQAGDDMLIDIVGTGGDGTHKFNISTIAAFVIAGAGVKVAKHGNRSNRRAGSADVLEALGATLQTTPEQAVACLEEVGIVFLFAPSYHPAMRYAMGPRRDIQARTIFNILGPLTNPAQPPFGVLGAYSLETARLMADAISGLDIDRVFVVHGAPAWDEPTPVGPFHVFDVRPSAVSHEVRDPADYGLARCSPDSLRGGGAAHNAQALRAVFAGEHSPHRDALCLSCALALEVSGVASALDEGLQMAWAALDDGRATGLLERLHGLNEKERTA